MSMTEKDSYNKGSTGTNSIVFKTIELFQHTSEHNLYIDDKTNISKIIINPFCYPHPFRKPGETINKNLILTGNICDIRSSKFLDFLYVESKLFKRVFFIPGEKEEEREEGEESGKSVEYLKNLVNSNGIRNVFILNNEAYIINNGTNTIKVIGTIKSIDYIKNEIEEEKEEKEENFIISELKENILEEVQEVKEGDEGNETKYILITQNCPEMFKNEGNGSNGENIDYINKKCNYWFYNDSKSSDSFSYFVI